VRGLRKWVRRPHGKPFPTEGVWGLGLVVSIVEGGEEGEMLRGHGGVRCRGGGGDSVLRRKQHGGHASGSTLHLVLRVTDWGWVQKNRKNNIDARTTRNNQERPRCRSPCPVVAVPLGGIHWIVGVGAPGAPDHRSLGVERRTPSDRSDPDGSKRSGRTEDTTPGPSNPRVPGSGAF